VSIQRVVDACFSWYIISNVEPHPLQHLLDQAVAVVPLQFTESDSETFDNLFQLRFETRPIAHYMGLRHFLTLLEKSEIHLNRLYKFLFDPDDGSYPHANLHTESGATAQLYGALPVKRDKEAMMVSNAIARTYSYAHCWFLGDTENQAMWKKFGDEGRGVCIQSNTQLLQHALTDLPSDLWLELVGCTYRDNHEPITELFSAAPAARKGREFAVEKECRLLARVKMESHKPDADGNYAEPVFFRKLGIDPSRLITGLITGPAMAPGDVEKLMLASMPFCSPALIRPSTLTLE
jgi:hypothetical protein